MKKAILLYVPVLHQGYLDLIKRHQPADIILITAESLRNFSKEIADQLSRDVRCLPVNIIAQVFHEQFPFSQVVLFDSIDYLKSFDRLVVNMDDISSLFKEKIINTVFELDQEFLRWDWNKATTLKEVRGAYPVSLDDKDVFFMSLAIDIARKSADIWRRVGAVVPISDTEVLRAYNEHFPSNTSPYENGDPRLHAQPGQNLEICTAGHAEAMLIAEAAREGRALKGKSMYITTFSCPVCARSIIKSGIKKVFFKEGYSTLDASEILTHAGVEVFQVR